MPDGISIHIDGISEMRDSIDAIIDKVNYAAKRAVTDGAELIERRAKQNAPVLTGTLRRSIHVNSVVQLGAGRWQSLTGPSTIYARQREFGGVIRVRNAPYLKFTVGGSGVYGKDGQWVQVKSVTQKGSHYMQRAFDESISSVYEIYKAAFREAFGM